VLLLPVAVPVPVAPAVPVPPGAVPPAVCEEVDGPMGVSPVLLDLSHAVRSAAVEIAIRVREE
jgi:hypothetical protein